MKKDMEDMFWEIPTSEIILALEWAAKHLKGSRSSLWFSIAKGGLRHLDRIGLASSSDFYGINFEQVFLPKLLTESGLGSETSFSQQFGETVFRI